LIHRIGGNMAFFRYIKDIRAVGLMFMENEQEALKILFENKETARHTSGRFEESC